MKPRKGIRAGGTKLTLYGSTLNVPGLIEVHFAVPNITGSNVTELRRLLCLVLNRSEYSHFVPTVEIKFL